MGGGPNPILDGGGRSGGIVVLANNNEVMGLTIQNGEYGIYGKDITGTNIHHNVIQGNGLSIGDAGIFITNNFTGSYISGMKLGVPIL